MNSKKTVKLIVIAAVVLLLAIAAFSSFTVVEAGHTGVVVTLGKVNGEVYALSGETKSVKKDFDSDPDNISVIRIRTGYTDTKFTVKVNGTQVATEEQLSDHVYRYDAKAKTISLADTTIEQLEAKVSENTQSYEATQSQAEAARPRHHR